MATSSSKREANRTAAQGDSGGPGYVESGDTFYLVGASARGTEAEGAAVCGDGGINTLVPAYLDWIASSAGEDWEPGPDPGGDRTPEDGTDGESDGTDPGIAAPNQAVDEDSDCTIGHTGRSNLLWPTAFALLAIMGLRRTRAGQLTRRR